MYATFAEDLTGFFGKWTLHAHAPRSKRLGSPVASKHSGRVNAATVSPIREPKWTDQTDEEDEDLFSEYFVDGGVTKYSLNKSSRARRARGETHGTRREVRGKERARIDWKGCARYCERAERKIERVRFQSVQIVHVCVERHAGNV